MLHVFFLRVYTCGMNNNKKRIASAVLALGLLLAIAPSARAINAPSGGTCSILSATADASSVSTGGSTTIRWAVNSSCTSVTLNGKKVARPKGSMNTGSLSSSTTYSLSAKGSKDSDADSVTVSVVDPSITITSLNDGGAFTKGQSVPISWKASGISSTDLVSFSIDIYNEYGSIVRTLGTGINNALASSGAATIYIPYQISDGENFKIRATLLHADGTPYLGQQGAIEDSSDNLLVIVSPSIIITSPNGGEVFTEGQTIPVSWESTGLNDDDKVYVSIDRYDENNAITVTPADFTANAKSGSGVIRISPSLVHGSSYSCKHFKLYVHVSRVGSSLIADDSSDDFFTINPAVVATTVTQHAPAIAYVMGKVNQHIDPVTGTWASDPDGKSGANIDKVNYCNKFYPGTGSISQIPNETITTWKRAANTRDSKSYIFTVPVYACNQTTATTGSSTGSVKMTTLVKGDAVSQSSVPALIQTLGRGIIGDDGVKSLQSALRQSGFLPASAAIDGSYGRLTERAVKDYQKQNGLPVTGTADQMLFNRIVAGQ